ncbi:MAG: aldo/keto reductase [Lachnospiraceae bacterium]|jgi:predicted aldo/keto reductase-like oxidoreductase
MKNQPAIGFGLSRLPHLEDGTVDIKKLTKLVDIYMASGFHNFETAYMYEQGKSELAFKETVSDRYPRASFWLTDKFPLQLHKGPEMWTQLFQTSLDRTGLEYIDLYYLHALDRHLAAEYEPKGIWEFMQKLKAEGKVKYIGFSTHDNAEFVEKTLRKHGDVIDYVQIQLNWRDWDNGVIQSRLMYESIRRHEKPITVMEPLRGGNLGTLSAEKCRILTDIRPNDSVASWGLRFAGSWDGVRVVHSGMNEEYQLEDNLNTFLNWVPMSDEEKLLLAELVIELEKTPAVKCTACGYCVDGCPVNINIPRIIALYNEYLVYRDLPRARRAYPFECEALKGRGLPSECIECGQCEEICTQHLNIIEVLKEIHKTLATPGMDMRAHP